MSLVNLDMVECDLFIYVLKRGDKLVVVHNGQRHKAEGDTGDEIGEELEPSEDVIVGVRVAQIFVFAPDGAHGRK